MVGQKLTMDLIELALGMLDNFKFQEETHFLLLAYMGSSEVPVIIMNIHENGKLMFQ